MAFSVSYSDSLSKNINHMYRVRDNTPATKRHPPMYKAPPDPNTPPIYTMYPRRFFDYFPDLGIGLPRAPAFREVSKATMNDIIARVSRPTLSRKDTVHKLCGGCQNCLAKKPASRRYGYQKVSRGQVETIVDRLSLPSKSPRFLFQDDSSIGDDGSLPPVSI